MKPKMIGSINCRALSLLRLLEDKGKGKGGITLPFY